MDYFCVRTHTHTWVGHTTIHPGQSATIMGQRPSKSKSKPSSAQSIVHPQLAPTASLRDVLAQERLGPSEQPLVE